ncbi:unnamed protein product [Rhizophagus irregularis]|nr:unnamed protein product [Rhizophagus irregularis]
MNTSLDSSYVNMSIILMLKSATVVHEDEKTLAQLWHEEIKCLFLRCRAPPDVAIERLVKNIFNYDLYSNNAEEVIGHSKRVLTDFRSKLLFRYLAATNKAKLKKCGIMERLVLFVVKAFKVHYVKYDVKTIKDLDRITMECKVPSRSAGLNGKQNNNEIRKTIELAEMTNNNTRVTPKTRTEREKSYQIHNTSPKNIQNSNATYTQDTNIQSNNATYTKDANIRSPQ